MKINPKSLTLVSLLISILILNACTAEPFINGNNTKIPATSSVFETTVQPASATLPSTPTFSSTKEIRNPTWTERVHPSRTPKPSATMAPFVLSPENPTPVPIPQENSFLNGLMGTGYQLMYGSSIAGPGGYLYSAYIFLDSSFEPYNPDGYTDIFNNLPYRENLIDPDETTEGCRIVFFRSDGLKNEFLYSFGAPKYP
jgi:hypothetical protein